MLFGRYLSQMGPTHLPYVPIDAARLTAALAEDPATAGWPNPRVVSSTGSTNADVVALAEAGAPRGTVVIAEEQVAGRGRLGRAWDSRAGSGIWMSVLLHPPLVASWSWLPLLVGVAVRDALVAIGAPVDLKWPNDVIAGDPYAKVAGLLIEAVPDPRGAVIGIGINVHPESVAGFPEATCVDRLVDRVDRTELAARVLTQVARDYAEWARVECDAVASGLAARYRAACRTLQWVVRVSLPDGSALVGRAVDIDADGRLRVEVDGQAHVIAAGDVTRVRPV